MYVYASLSLSLSLSLSFSLSLFNPHAPPADAPPRRRKGLKCVGAGRAQVRARAGEEARISALDSLRITYATPWPLNLVRAPHPTVLPTAPRTVASTPWPLNIVRAPDPPRPWSCPPVGHDRKGHDRKTGRALSSCFAKQEERCLPVLPLEPLPSRLHLSPFRPAR